MEESKSDDGRLIQFTYESPSTGVYCIFDLSVALDECQAQELTLPEEYEFAHLAVSINYLRPQFFALELMPLASAIAVDLELWLYDPQTDKMHSPGSGSVVLVNNWTLSNDKITRAMAQEKEPLRKPYLPREDANYWWEYTLCREGFQTSLLEDVFVPSIFLIATNHHPVQTMVMWSAESRRNALQSKPEPLAQVFPVCDYVMLTWDKSTDRLMHKALVPYITVIEALAGLVKEINGPVLGLKVLLPEKQRPASAIFERLSKFEMPAITRISSDGFTDVQIEDHTS